MHAGAGASTQSMWFQRLSSFPVRSRSLGAYQTLNFRRFANPNSSSVIKAESTSSAINEKTVEEKKRPGSVKLAGSSSDANIRQLRIQKAEELRSNGRDPYAYNFPRTHTSHELQLKYADLENGQQMEDTVSVAGRVMTRRVMGKLAFAQLVDSSGSIQLYVDRNTLDGEQENGFSVFKNLVDSGDIVGVEGGIRRTDKGELSVVVRKLHVLTKSLLPLPDKWHGLTDIEMRYRRRYLDMIVNPQVVETLKSRSKVVSTLRRYLEGQGFLEVETPVLESAAGGADARPFLTYHNALGRDFSLRIATELHLKRLVVGGLEKVFEIGRIFRNEGISTRHNPEFTSIELYQAYADYNDMMTLTETLIRECAITVHGTAKINYQGLEIDLEKPFRRATMNELVLEATGIDFLKSFSADTLAAAKETGLEIFRRMGQDNRAEHSKVLSSTSIGNLLNTIFEAVVEDTLQQPTFVLDHPIEISPLAKKHRSDEGVVERFELFVAGRELANSFSELTDPVDQRNRLEKQIAAHNAARAKEIGAQQETKKDIEDDDASYDVALDEDFITALEYGMPPTGGMGMGIDRLVMLLTDSASIRDVIAFPLLK